MIDGIVRDLRFAARGLRRSPGFSAAAVVTLALGIGATTAVFSVVYGVIFRPLPFPNAGRLVQVVQLLPQRPGQNERLRAGLTADQVTEWRATSCTLAEMRVPLRGRDVNERDRAQQAGVVIVNETFARRFLGAEDPIGRQIQFQEWPALTIIGVAGDTRTRELDSEINPAVYLPQELKSAGFGAPTYVLRAPGKAGVLAEVRAAAARIDAGVVVFDATSMNALLARSVTTPRLYSATALGFAAVAVTLAALGLYVLSYSIGTRTREFGIRIALGANSRTVVTNVMREALATVLLGIVIGLAAARYVSRFLEALLYGVQPGDPVTLGAVAVLFLGVAALACYVPARRATRIDPITALREA